MTYIKYIEPVKIKRFRTRLNEVNFGALQKDTRIKTIADKIFQSIKESVKISKYSNIVDITYQNKQLKLEWVFDFHTSFYIQDTFIGATFQKTESNKYKIYITVSGNKKESTTQKNQRIVKSIEDKELDEFLFHEVKHLIDSLDGIFKTDNYVMGPDPFTFDSSNSLHLKAVSKYISQDKEIDAQLISVVASLEYIHRKNENITFKKALAQSSAFDQFMKYLDPSKKKKYIQKIIYFWNTLDGKFGKGDEDAELSNQSIFR